jgi:hypothetical protein
MEFNPTKSFSLSVTTTHSSAWAAVVMIMSSALGGAATRRSLSRPTRPYEASLLVEREHAAGGQALTKAHMIPVSLCRIISDRGHGIEITQSCRWVLSARDAVLSAGDSKSTPCHSSRALRGADPDKLLSYLHDACNSDVRSPRQFGQTRHLKPRRHRTAADPRTVTKKPPTGVILRRP